MFFLSFKHFSIILRAIFSVSSEFNKVVFRWFDPSHLLSSFHGFKANFALPEVGDFLDEVTFVELQKVEAEELVKRYNEEGRKAGPPPEKRMDSWGTRRRESSHQQYDNHGGSRGDHRNRGAPAGGYRGGGVTL